MGAMPRQLKLIWDFRGTVAEKTAAHHELHLKEYIAINGIDPTITGHTKLSEMHSIAYMVVNEHDMPMVRDRLKPHRGELYQQNQ